MGTTILTNSGEIHFSGSPPNIELTNQSLPPDHPPITPQDPPSSLIIARAKAARHLIASLPTPLDQPAPPNNPPPDPMGPQPMQH